MKFAVHERQKPPGPAHTSDSRLAPAAIHQVLNSPGESLHTETRRFFEPRFGFDFSQVRVHADSAAAASARAVDAAAYSVGRHIAFDSGKYAPNSPLGRQLLAHELAHTVQQSQATRTGALSLRASDASEKEADRAAFPKAQDRFNQDWKNMNPNEKSIGPFNIPFKPFKWEF